MSAKLSRVCVLSYLRLSGYSCGSVSEGKGGGAEFCRVTTMTHSHGGECMVGLTTRHALLSWLILML